MSRTRRAIDRLDGRLLLELVREPRATVVALAERTRLARNTVQARLVRLELDGLLPYDHRIDPSALGYPLTAFIMINVKQRDLDGLGTALEGVPEVLEVIGLTGDTDLLVRVVATDADDLYRVAGRILALRGVERTNTALAMRTMVAYRVTPLLERLLEDRQ